MLILNFIMKVLLNIVVLILGSLSSLWGCSTKNPSEVIPDENGGKPKEELQLVTFDVKLTNKQQVIDGFGASDAWTCHMVGRYWPNYKKEAIADLLFSQDADEDGNPKGIGLSLWRFNLGAGSYEQGDASSIPDEWHRGESFLNQDGSYDWNKLIGQRWFLRAARDRGVEQFLLFTNSPHVSMTKNGKAFSPTVTQNMNIKDGYMERFAEYLVHTIDNVQSQEDIKFQYVSPINEPQWPWAANEKGEYRQEGTPATNAEMYELTKSLSEKLSERLLSTEVALGEAGSIWYLYENVNDELRDNQIHDFWSSGSPYNLEGLPNVAKLISGHSYGSTWPISSQAMHRNKLLNKLKSTSPDLKYWQTEYCVLESPGTDVLPGGSGPKRDLGMQTALYVARIIHNDLVLANASSWQWWTAISRVDYKDGLIYIDDGVSTGSDAKNYAKFDGRYLDSKLLWTLGNYSYFVRPGMERVEANSTEKDDVLISAYKDVSSQKLVVVVINHGDKKIKGKINMHGGNIKGNLKPYLTDESADLKLQEAVNSDDFEIPAKSIVTYVGDIS